MTKINCSSHVPGYRSYLLSFQVQGPTFLVGGLLTPTKDQFPLHGVDIALQRALGTASDYWWKFASYLYSFYYERNLCYRKFRGIRPGAFYKSGVLNDIIKFTGKWPWRSWKTGSLQLYQKSCINCITDVFLWILRKV